MDGLGAAKVANEALNADVVKLIKYELIDEKLVRQLKNEKVKKIVMCDIFVHENFIKALEKNFEVLIIDHHPTIKDYNSEKVTFINAQGMCAAYICYYLFSKIQDIEKLDWLIACSCIADFCWYNNQEFLSKVFEKYGDKFELNGKVIRESGKFWDLQWNIILALIYFAGNEKKVFDSIGQEFGELGGLERHVTEVRDYLDDCIKKFWKEKQEINGRYFWEFTTKFKVGSLVSNMVSLNVRDRTFIIGRIDGNGLYHFSCRRQDKGEDMNLLAKKMVSGLRDFGGGGHIAAAAGHVLLKEREKLLERLKKL